MSITRPWAEGPGCPGGTWELGTTGGMEASWTISWLIRIVLALRLHLASLSFAGSGNSKGRSCGRLYLPRCCLDSGRLHSPCPRLHATGLTLCSSGRGQGSVT